MRDARRAGGFIVGQRRNLVAVENPLRLDGSLDRLKGVAFYIRDWRGPWFLYGEFVV
jgi:hypothetical protein